jgi:hypothetical protein
VSDRSTARRCALVVAVGFAGLVAFQLALIAGAPLAQAAWGGGHTVLPTSLRLGSAITVLIYSLASSVILRRGGFPIRWISGAVARWSAWAVVIILALSALANVASESPWERFLMAPTALILAVLSLVVVRSGARDIPAMPAKTDDVAFSGR